MKPKRTLSGARLAQSIISWLMLVISLIWMIPIVFAVANSFKTMGEVITDPVSMPTSLYLKNFSDVWEQIDYPHLFMNSVIVLVLSELGLVVLCSMTGYWLQRNIRKRSARLCKTYFSLSMFIPFQAIMVSLVALFSNAKLTSNHTGLIIANIGLTASMAIFLYFGYVQQIPKELDEAAAMDGASPVQTYFRIILPLMKPMTSTVLILTGLGVWNNYMRPVLLVNNKEYFTLPVGTASVIHGQYFTRYNLAVTTLLMAALPMIIAFIFLQKKIISGAMNGAVKG